MESTSSKDILASRDAGIFKKKQNKLNFIKKSSKWVQSGRCILNGLEITSKNVKDIHFQNQENIKDSRMQKL